MLLLVLLLMDLAEILRVSDDGDGGETLRFLVCSCEIKYWGDHSTELLFWISPRWRWGRGGVAVLYFMVSARLINWSPNYRCSDCFRCFGEFHNRNDAALVKLSISTVRLEFPTSEASQFVIFAIETTTLYSIDTRQSLDCFHSNYFAGLQLIWYLFPKIICRSDWLLSEADEWHSSFDGSLPMASTPFLS